MHPIQTGTLPRLRINNRIHTLRLLKFSVAFPCGKPTVKHGWVVARRHKVEPCGEGQRLLDPPDAVTTFFVLTTAINFEIKLMSQFLHTTNLWLLRILVNKSRRGRSTG